MMPITTKIATVGNAAPDSAWDSHRRLSHTYLVLVSVTAVANRRPRHCLLWKLRDRQSTIRPPDKFRLD